MGDLSAVNILIVHPCKGFSGGAEEVVVRLSDYLRENGHETAIITRDAPEEWDERDDVVHCGSSWGMRKNVRKLIAWGWPDVVNFHNFPATLTTFPKKVPTVWFCHEPPELFTSLSRKPIEALNRWWVRNAGMKCVVADGANAERFEGIYGISPSIVPYGVDYEFWSSGGPRYILPDVRILHVGTISPYKNQLASLGLLMELTSRGIDARLTWVGEVGDKEYNQKLAGLLNTIFEYPESRITYYGHQSREELRDLFRGHSFLFHPVKGQGGWLAPFEAMCAGLPVIVGDEFTASDRVRDYDLGLVANGDPADLVENETYKRYGENSVGEWVRDNLGWDKFGERMASLFEGAV